MNIVVAGVGALGSHFIQFSRNLRDARFKIVDFDRVEIKNIQAQFYSRTSTGKTKTEALRQLMDFLFRTPIDGAPARLSSVNVDALIPQDTGLVVDCLDNGASRRLIQAHVRSHRIPCLHGALAADGEFGRVIWDESFVVDDAPPSAPTCTDGNALPFIALTSAYLAQAAAAFVTNGKKIGFSISPAGCIRV